jgi:hypothetical protein
MNFHTVFLCIGLLTVAGTLLALRKEHIRPEYSVSWLIVGIVLVALAASPGLLDKAARSIGIGPESCFLVAAGTLVAAIVFEISRVVSRLRDDNTMMAQRIAILEYQIQEIGRRNAGQAS